MRSVYIHIPFCKSKCYYCDFNSYSGKENLIENYVDAVVKEIEQLPKSELKVNTLYFGGGTPSIVPAKFLSKIINKISCDGEITIEVNPGTIDEEQLSQYKKMGINRLSIGLQVTQDELLKKIGRIHTLEDFEKTYKSARKVEFENISVDLMIGLSNQTFDDVKESIKYILNLNPEHISVYSLIIHDELVGKHPNAFKDLPSDDEERKMYHYVCETLAKSGYIQYEISNFAKKGFESKHNLCYWNQKEYYGFGAGASSYIDGVRYKNVDKIEEYIDQVNHNEMKRVIEEEQNTDAKLREYIILKLRLAEGVSKEEVLEHFKVDFFEKFEKEIQKLLGMELIEKYAKNGQNGVKLTKKGLDFANIVWEEFI